MATHTPNTHQLTMSGFPWSLALWLCVFGVSVFGYPPCLDRYLAPRFFFLSCSLLVIGLWYWRFWLQCLQPRFHAFDALALVWYLFNAASITWAFSTSEAIFYTQKVLLFALFYGLLRCALLHDETRSIGSLSQIFVGLSVIYAAIVSGQLLYVVATKNYDNEVLYEYASAISGNKSLAAAFLCFLLISNVLFRAEKGKNKLFWPLQLWLLSLILLLQTRTVYLAVLAAGCVFAIFSLRTQGAGFNLRSKSLWPAWLAVVVLGVFLVFAPNPSNGLMERLNPLTYLDSETANERRFVWYKTDLLNQDHYWIGVGNGSWKLLLPSKNLQGGYRQQEQNVVFTRAHNDYLEIRAELGIVGVVLFIALFVLAAGSAFMGLGVQRKLSRGALMGLAAYAVVQFFDFPRERMEMQVALAVFIACALHAGRQHWRMYALPTALKKPLFAVILALLALNVWISWQRIMGETYIVKMLEAHGKGNHSGVLQALKKAQNPFLHYDDAAMPLEWYEGVAYFQQKRYPEAENAFLRAFDKAPWSFQVINNLASAQIQNQAYQKAIPLLEKTVEINPKFTDGKFNLAFANYQLGQLEAAEAWLAKIDTVPNPKQEADIQKNKAVTNRLNAFRAVIAQKKAGNK